jgi:guanylate kinase
MMSQTNVAPEYRLLVVVSGPSGSGKETMLRHVLEFIPGLSRVTTYTTRPPRPGEAERNQYHFISDSEFDGFLKDGTIFESETVYGSFRYGSPRLAVDGAGEGDLIMELDPKGFRKMKQTRPGPTVGIFLLVPDAAELKRRILARHPEADLDRRLETAIAQLSDVSDYDYAVLNDDLETSSRQISDIVRVEQLRRDGIIHLQSATRSHR